MKLMVPIVCTCTILTIISSGICRPEKFLNHVEMMNNFPCDKPQPRALDVKDQLDHEQRKEFEDYDIFPPKTKLHKCDWAGFCGRFDCCQAVQTKEVNRVCILTKKGKYVYRTITFTEDVKCACYPLN